MRLDEYNIRHSMLPLLKYIRPAVLSIVSSCLYFCCRTKFGNRSRKNGSNLEKGKRASQKNLER
jgi:hypothetical protein